LAQEVNKVPGFVFSLPVIAAGVQLIFDSKAQTNPWQIFVALSNEIMAMSMNVKINRDWYL